MKTVIKVITWNCHRANASSKLWEYFYLINPDVAFLQEVITLPDTLIEQYEIRSIPAIRKNGKSQVFSTVIMVKGKILNTICLTGRYDWVNNELNRFYGNLIAFEFLAQNNRKIKSVCVYSPAWPVDQQRLVGIDLSNVKLELNQDIWVADLLYDAIRNTQNLCNENWIIAGDFNLSETFDLWPGGPRGNREYLDKMIEIGLTECLRFSQGKLTPTFKNTHGSSIKHQMDHIFVTKSLKNKLIACYTGSMQQVFDQELSDHLPVIAEFEF